MIKIVDIKPLANFKLHLKYNDGVQGDIDLSYLAGKGVFKDFLKEDFFNNVWIDDAGVPTWENDLDIDPINAYLKITGKSFEQYLTENKE
jgi:hypothetical protein